MNKIISLFGVKRLIDCRTIATRLNADGKEIPKKKNFENRITLIGIDNSVSITDLNSAESLSERRGLKLVKIQDLDSKTRRPLYRLMTNAEYHEEGLQKRKEKQTARLNNSSKGEKLLTLSSRIGEHDLMTSVKKMMKLLERQYEVRVVIACEGDQGLQITERMYSVIEKNTKSAGKLVQKRNKGNNLKFQILPIKDSSSHSASNSEPDQNGNPKGPL